MSDDGFIGTPRQPWCWPCCGFDARGRSYGDPCGECGVPLGEASCRRVWTEARNLVRMRGAAWLGVGAGSVVFVIPAVLAVSAAIVPAEMGAWVAIASVVLLGLSWVAQAVAVLRIASSGLPSRLRLLLRTGAWLRIAGVAIGVAMPVVIAFVEVFSGTSPMAFSIATMIVLMFGCVLIVGGDLLISTRLFAIRRSVDLSPAPIRGLVAASTVVLQALTLPLVVIPFLGWILAPLLWAALPGVAMLVLLDDLRRIAARMRD